MCRFLLIMALVVVVYTGAMSQSRADVERYIASYRATALQFEKEYGIPAPITLAQGILESGAGTSSLTRACNNHFCIKAGSSWNGPVYLAWDDEAQKSRFRSYSSADDSFRDYARLISTSRNYSQLFEINTFDYRRWAQGLKKAGYATAPNYASALIGIIEQYKLYTINGGVKLRPGKKVVITRHVESQKMVFDEECIAPDDEHSAEQQAVIAVIQRYAVEINGIHCTVIQPGETLSSVARRHNISPLKLLEYNEMFSENQAKEGDIIFLDKKKKKYNGAQDFYIAKGGETLHEVSQLFGLQLHNLAKMNGLNDYITLCEGFRIMLK